MYNVNRPHLSVQTFRLSLLDCADKRANNSLYHATDTPTTTPFIEFFTWSMSFIGYLKIIIDNGQACVTAGVVTTSTVEVDRSSAAAEMTLERDR